MLFEKAWKMQFIKLCKNGLYLGRNYIYIFFGNIHSSNIEETFYVPALFLALGMQFTEKYYMPGSK